MIPAIIEKYEPGKHVSAPKNTQVVLVGGCFDILHYGHLQFLERARMQGDFLVVALEPDETITGLKKRKPVHTQALRASNLAAIRYVDKVLMLPVLAGFEGYRQLTLDVHPQVLATTAGDRDLANLKLHAAAVNAEIKIVNEHVSGLSSSDIQEEGNLKAQDAKRLHVE